MRYIEFTKLGFSNFKRYQNQVKIDFEPAKITLISGKNGAGKTTIFDAVFFALYGYTSKGLRSSSVVNEKSKKNCHVWIEWKENQDKFRVDRYVSHSKFRNSVFLQKNGTKIAVGQKEVAPTIEKLLIPKNLFVNTVFFPQKTKSFFTDLTDGEQKEIFRKILELDKLQIYQKKCTEKLDDALKRKIKVENEIHTLSELTKELTCQKDTYLKEQEIFNKDKENSLRKIQESINHNKKKIQEIQKALAKTNPSDTKRQKIDLENKIQVHQEAVKNLNFKIQTLNLEAKQVLLAKKEELQNEINKQSKIIKDKGYDSISKLSILEYPSEINDIKDTIKKISNKIYSIPIKSTQTQIQELSNSIFLQDKCPVCGQVIGKDSKCNIQSKLSDLTKQEKNYQDEKQKLEQKLRNLQSNLENELKKYEDSKKLLQSKINSIKSKIQEDTEQIKLVAKKKLQKIAEGLKIDLDMKVDLVKKDIKSHTKKLQDFVDKKDNLEKILDNLEKLQALKDRYQDTVSIYEKQRKDLESNFFDKSKIILVEKKIQDNESMLHILEQEILELDKNVEIYQFWKEGFSKSGLESMLIDECLPFINERIKEYQNILSNGRYIITFDTLTTTKSGDLRDKTSISVLDTETLTDSKDMLSGGQERLVDISVILTLADLQSKYKNISFNLVLFDEIFDSLDSECTERVCKILKVLSKRDKSIFVISHRDVDQIETDEKLEL